MTYFDELRETDGLVRLQYREFYHDFNKTNKKERKQQFTRSKLLFNGDYFQDLFPRVLTFEEYSEIKKGTEQRALAILAFLEDLISDGPKWSKVIPKHILELIFKRHRTDMQHIQNLQYPKLAFPYGPDIIRDSRGAWRVIEDSAGTLGGIGDIPHCRHVLYKIWPEWKRKIETGRINATDTHAYFQNLSEHFHKKSNEHGGIPLLLLPAYSREPDGETQRLANLFRRFGIESTTEQNRHKTVQINPGKLKGPFLKSKSGLQKIGAFICHYPLESLTGLNFTLNLEKYKTDQKYQTKVINRITKVLSRPSYSDLVTAGEVWCNYTPGLRFLNDKIFGMYVDRMVRILLKASPLIPGIRLRSFSSTTKSGIIRFNSDLWKTVRRNPEQYVIKKVDEDGGSHVWLGNRMSSDMLVSLGDKIKLAPEQYVVQDFEHLSVLNGNIVDLRIHTQVDSEKLIINQTAWGRANFINSDGKVNLGSNGFCSPIIVLKNNKL